MSTKRRSDRKRFITRQVDQDGPSINSVMPLATPTNSRSSLVLNGHVTSDNQVSAFVRVKPSPKNYNKFSLESVANISSSGLDRRPSTHCETLTTRQNTPEQVRTAIGFRPIGREDSIDSESSASVASNDRLQTTTPHNNNNNTTYRRRQQQLHTSPVIAQRLVGVTHRVSSVGSASSYDNLESIGLTTQVEQSPRTSRRQHTWQPQQLQQQQHITDDNNITDNGFMPSNVVSGKIWRRPTFGGHIQVVPPTMVGVFDPRLTSSRYHVTSDSSLPVPSQTSLPIELSHVLSPVRASRDISTSQTGHVISPAHYNNVSHVTNSAVTSPRHVTSPPLTSSDYSRPSVDTAVSQSCTSNNTRLDGKCCTVTSESPVHVETVLTVQPVESTIRESQQWEEQQLVEQPDQQQDTETTQQQSQTPNNSNNTLTITTTTTTTPTAIVSAAVNNHQQQLTPTTDDNKLASPNTPDITQQHDDITATSQTPTDLTVTSLHDVMSGELIVTSHGAIVGQLADVKRIVRNCQPSSPTTTSPQLATTTTTVGTLSPVVTHDSSAITQQQQCTHHHRVTSPLRPFTNHIIHSTSPVKSSAGLDHVTSQRQESVSQQATRQIDETVVKQESRPVTAGCENGTCDNKLLLTSSQVNHRTQQQRRTMAATSLQPNTVCVLARLSPIPRPTRPTNNNNNNNRSQSVDRSRHESETRDNRRTAAAATTTMRQEDNAMRPVVDNLMSEGVNVLAALDSALAVLTSCVGGDSRQHTPLLHRHTYRHVQAPCTVTSPLTTQQQQHVECDSGLQLQQSTTTSVQTTVSTTTTTCHVQCRQVAAVARHSFTRPESPSTPTLLDDSHKPTLYSLPADCVILRHRRRHKRDVTTSVGGSQLRQSLSNSSTSSDDSTETGAVAATRGTAGLTRNKHTRRSRINKTRSRVKQQRHTAVTSSQSVDQLLVAPFNNQLDDNLTTWIINPVALTPPTATTTTTATATATGGVVATQLNTSTSRSETGTVSAAKLATLTPDYVEC